MRRISTLKYFLVISFLLTAFTPNPAYAYNCDNWVAKLQSAQGSVQIRKTNKQWLQVNRNDSFCKGDVLRVQENSRAALLLRNDTLLRLNQNTTITFTNLSPDKPSVVSVTTGFAHFISRVKAAFEVITPFINAAIEGTEFVVAVEKGKAEVTVFEGTVRVYNQHGEVRLTANQTAQAKKGQAPVLTLKAKPRDAVNWSLYYPAILDNKTTPLLAQAAKALNVGKVEKAKRLLQKSLDNTPKNSSRNSSALAMQAMISIVQNNKAQGLKLAQQAVAANSNNSTTKLALSYAQQAYFKIDQALHTLQLATANESDNALIWSRLAEVYLMHGELDKALNAAKKANELNPELGRTHTVLGFAYLTQNEIKQATDSFNKAIEKDQANPFARLGLGLASIRHGDLNNGRREIEYAATLDPNNALIRSYLGKAYYEEKRNKLAATQFKMAKALDPNDPTAYFYDAIRLQSENMPSEALLALEQAIKRNNNKAVYRSSQLLDQDAAVQALSQARFYNKLGLQQRALSSAQASLAKNPANHAAHRFMADAYAGQSRSEVGRVSEALVAQLLQPINALPVQAKLTENNLSTINQSGISNLSYNEYSPLFLQNGAYVYSSGYAGTDNTKSSDITLAAVQDKFAFSLSGYRYLTNGFRDNADTDETVYNAFAQAAITPTFSVQAEAKKWQRSIGDIDMLFDPTNFSTTDRRYVNQNIQRIGIHQKPGVNSDIIVSLSKSKRRTNIQILGSSQAIDEKLNTELTQSEFQYLHTGANSNIQVGFAKHDIGVSQVQVIDWSQTFGVVCPVFLAPSSCGSTLNYTTEQDIFYIYTQFKFPGSLSANLSGSYDTLDTRGLHISKFNPKVGLKWSATPNTSFNFAYFETVKRPLFIQQTIEPTQVSGFNQFYDERNGTTASNYAIGFNADSDKLSYGLSAQRRDLRIPQFSSNAFTKTQPRRENIYRGYINWLASTNWSFSFSPEKEVYNNQAAGPTRLSTIHIPISARYHIAKGISASYKLNYVRQKVTLADSSFSQSREDFITFDLGLRLNLDKRLGYIGLEVSNLFKQNFIYQDLNFLRAEPVYARYLPLQTILLKASLNF